MVSKQEIEFTIKPDGNVEFSVKGVKGKQCVPIAELFKMLGKTTAEHPTSEYYDEQQDNQVSVGEGSNTF